MTKGLGLPDPAAADRHGIGHTPPYSGSLSYRFSQSLQTMRVSQHACSRSLIGSPRA